MVLSNLSLSKPTSSPPPAPPHTHRPRYQLQISNINLTLYNDLDRARLRIRRRLKRLHRILDIEPMRHQPLQIDHAALHQPDGARPRVGVPVLELQVDFLGAEAHERDLHVWLADADDEDFAAEFDGPDGRRDGGFDAGAFEGDGGPHAAARGDDVGGRAFGADFAGDFVGARARAELFGEVEAALVDVGDDDGFGASGGAAKEGDEPDGAGAADEDGIAEADARALHTG